MKRTALYLLSVLALASPALAQHLVWQFPSANASFAPAVAADGTAYVPTSDGHLVAVGTDGLQKWTAALNDTPSTGVLLLADGTAVVGTTIGKVVDVKPDGSMGWTFSAGAGILNPLAAAPDGTVYAASGDNMLHAIAAGGMVKWTVDALAMITGAPSVGTDGTVFLGTTNTELYAYNPADGSKKWDFSNIGADPTQAAAAPGGGADFVSTDGNLFFIDNKGNQINEAFPSRGSRFIPVPVVLADGSAVVNESDGMLHAVKPDGTDEWAVNLGTAGARPVLGKDGRIYTSGMNQVAVLDASGGVKLKLPVNGTPMSVVPSANGMVLALIGSGGVGMGNSFLIAISPNPPAANAWQRSGLDGKNVYHLAVAPGTPGAVYAATDGSLWMSTDAGKTWVDTAVGAGLNGMPSGLTVKSVDVGAGDTAWAIVNDVLATGKAMKWSLTAPLMGYDSVAADPKTPLHGVMARSSDGEVQETTDGGSTTTLPTPPNGVRSVAYSPNGSLFALTGAGLQMRDATGSWVTVEGSIPWTAIDFSADGSVVLLGGAGKTARSADGGKTFAVAPSPTLTGTIRAITMDPGTPNTLYAATALPSNDVTTVKGINVYTSIDGGAQWALFNDGLSTLDVYALKAVPGSVARILMGTSDGVWAVGATSGGPPPMVVPGDLNGDGKVSVIDATLALRFAIGLAVPSPTQLAAGDFNGNGKIDVSDATRILRKAVGLG